MQQPGLTSWMLHHKRPEKGCRSSELGSVQPRHVPLEVAPQRRLHRSSPLSFWNIWRNLLSVRAIGLRFTQQHQKVAPSTMTKGHGVSCKISEDVLFLVLLLSEGTMHFLKCSTLRLNWDGWKQCILPSKCHLNHPKYLRISKSGSLSFC